MKPKIGIERVRTWFIIQFSDYGDGQDEGVKGKMLKKQTQKN